MLIIVNILLLQKFSILQTGQVFWDPAKDQQTGLNAPQFEDNR